MMNSYEYVEARVADHRSHAERARRGAPVRERRAPAQRLGEMLRHRAVKPNDINEH